MKQQDTTELWRLVQAAFDRKRRPSEDVDVLDWLFEHPEQAHAMDEVLMLEERLQALAAVRPSASKRPWVWLALAAAGVLAIWVPSLWHRAGQGPKDPSGPNAPSGLSRDDSASHDSALAVASQVPAGVANIVSFEFAIQHSGSREVYATQRDSEADRSIRPSQATIHTLTSTRTRTAPRGANVTY